MRARTAPPDRFAIGGFVLSALFAVRVLGQAVQRWLPQPFLPPAEAFQGSSLPYALLLIAQLVILFVMLHVTLRMRSRTLVPNRRLGIGLAWAGAIYAAVCAGRIAIGLGVPDADPWFSTWIPAFFHLILASFFI
jgi:hypothetical protein